MRTIVDIENFFKAGKGIQGYINKQKVIEILKTLLMFSVSLIIYFAGLTTLGTNKSIWTIIAILGILPASKSAVSMIMFLRYKSISLNDYADYKNAAGNIPSLYELIFTTREKSFFVKTCSCSMNTVIILAEENNKNSKYIKEVEEHINACLLRDGIKGVLVKVYTDKPSYIARLSEMKNKLYDENDTSYERIFNVFLSVTL